jgi:Ulp1 family protease
MNEIKNNLPRNLSNTYFSPVSRHIVISYEDLLSLAGTQWIIGYAIDGFLECFEKYNPAPSGTKPVIWMWTIYKPFTLGRPFDDSFFDCFMRDWTREDMQQAVAFAVPININNAHWFAAVIIPAEKCIYMLDHYYTNREYEDIFVWMKDWFRFMVNKYNLHYDVDTFIKKKHNDVRPRMSKQTDGISCGAILAADIVHLIKYGRLANKDDYRNADMPEFRKYMQLTVILAKQISQIEESDNDVTFLQEIYNFNEEERRLHTFDRDIDTNTIDILGGGSK